MTDRSARNEPSDINLRVLGVTRDLRWDTRVIYTQMPVSTYLWLVGETFDEFEIQRKRQKHRIYERMESDVREGALLPGITLAVKFDRVQRVLEQVPTPEAWPIDSGTLESLRDVLFKPGMVNILDGLQRTHVLRDIADSGHEFDHRQAVLAEIWVEPDLSKLIYRIIILNAGQKPMSLRHQVELLFLTVKEQILKDIPSLEIYKETDETRRRGPKKLAFDRVVSSYHAFINGDPEVKKANIIANELLHDELSALSEERLHDDFQQFIDYLRWYVKLDEEVCRVYPTKDGDVPTGANWFGSENVMVGFFAATADFGRSDSRRARIHEGLRLLLGSLEGSAVDDDPLGLETFQKVVQGINPRRTNVGRATRKLLFRGFKEFFREEGEKPLDDCWLREAE